MLDPNEIIKLSERSEIVAAELQEEIVKDICERIALRLGRGDDYILTARDKWQLEVLKEAGYLVDDLIKIIAKKTGVTVKEMRKAFAEAGVSSTKFDDLTYEQAGLPVIPIQQSPAMIRLLERGMNKTFSEWKNYTGTTVRAAYELYVKECDKAYNNVLSGHMTYGEAVKIALDTASSKGGVVEYPSGHIDTLETATYRAVRTGISQACSDVTSVRAAENGITLFITSSHLGARPTHEPWQGKVFWVDWDLLSAALGITYENPNTPSINEKAKYDEFVKTTEIGTVTGLCGANCRHSYGPYIEGISHNPYTQFDSEENRKRYEAEQTQRSFERRIRKQRRKVEGLKAGLKEMDPSVANETRDQLKKEQAKLNDLQRQYKEYSEDQGLKVQTNRLEIVSDQSANETPKRLVDQDHSFAEGSYRVKSAEDAQERLSKIIPTIDEYTAIKSNYSRRVIILNKDANVAGYADYNGDIYLKIGAEDCTLIHEYLHTKSASKYDPSYYRMVKILEEGTVEYFTRQICVDQGIPFSTGAYDDNVLALHFLYSFSSNYDSELDFAKDLFNQIPDMRYSFLKGLKYREDLEDYQKEVVKACLNFFKMK